MEGQTSLLRLNMLFEKKVNKKNLRLEFKNREEKLKKIRDQINLIPQYKQNAIEQVIEKMKNDVINHKPFTGKSNWGKSDRILYNSEYEYLGEQIPFWNNNSKEEDKKKSEFYPMRLKILRRSPSWSFGPDKKDDNTKEQASQYIKARDERLEEKANLYDFEVPKAVYYFNSNFIGNNDLNQIQKDNNLFKFFLWLKDINLELYFFNFVNNGYFSIDLLLIQMISKNPLTDEILKNEIFIEKLGYRTRIMNKLEEEYPLFLEKLKNLNTMYINKENSRICSDCTIF